MQQRINRAEQLLKRILTGFGDELNEEVLKRNILLAAELTAELPPLSKEMEEEIVTKFMPLIYSDFEILRQETQRILKGMKDTSIGLKIKDELTKRLVDENGEINLDTATALGSLGMIDEQIVEPLKKAVEDENPYVRKRAAEALGSLGIADKRIVELLKKRGKYENLLKNQSKLAI